MKSLLIGVLTVVPSLLLLWYVYSRDQFAEPRALLLKTFLFGVLICGPASRLGIAFWPQIQALSQRFKLLALGLGSAIFLHALTDAFLYVPDLRVALLAIPMMGLDLFWGWRLFKPLRDEQERLFLVLEHRERELAAGRFGTGSEPVPEVAWAAVPSQPPRERTWWAWIKLLLGGMGLCFCALLWLATFIGIYEKLSTGMWGDAFGFMFAALLMFVLPIWLFLWMFRSGLRGPFVTPAISGGNFPDVPSA